MFNRRPIASRSSSLAQNTAKALASTSITPNQISLFSIVFAGAATACMVQLPTILGFILAAVGIQLRLLCNLLDGMVAVEHNKTSPLGVLYNEIPDRISDTLLLVGMGYAVHVEWLGWTAALLALMTAYIRVFGGALGQAQDFRGPMSKSHRMAALTIGCISTSAELWLGSDLYALKIIAIIIVFGSGLTCINRLLHITQGLK